MQVQDRSQTMTILVFPAFLKDNTGQIIFTERLERFGNGLDDAVLVESEWIKFAYARMNSPVKFSTNSFWGVALRCCNEIVQKAWQKLLPVCYFKNK